MMKKENEMLAEITKPCRENHKHQANSKRENTFVVEVHKLHKFVDHFYL